MKKLAQGLVAMQHDLTHPSMYLWQLSLHHTAPKQDISCCKFAYADCPLPSLQNSPYWEITAGFIGSVKATVPITTLSTNSCQAVLDEILLTVKPRSLHHPSVHGVSASTHLSGSNLLAADLDDQPVAQDIMTDGIMQIAGGIETIVQQLQLQVYTLTVAWLLMCPSLYLTVSAVGSDGHNMPLFLPADSSCCQTLLSV